MSARRVAELLLRLLAAVVLVASGTYLLVYLYRWEWNRALVSGLFLLAAELAIIAGALGRRLNRIERILADHQGQAHERRIRERLAATPAPRKVNFAWLRDPLDGAGVFVPVLLGAGAVLSALAYVVEKLAVTTADPVLQRDLAGRLAPLRMPDGGFTPGAGGRATFSEPELPNARDPMGRRLTSWVIMTMVIALFATSLIWGIAKATQAQQEPNRSGEDTWILLSVRSRDPDALVQDTFALLWSSCQARVPEGVGLSRVDVLTDEVVRVRLDHGLGRTAARKLGGCLEDAEVELIQGRILEMIIVSREPDDAPIDPRWQDPTVVTTS